jgi:hypothetical protein
VNITVSGPAMTTITQSFAASTGSGSISNVPAGNS